MPIEPEYPKTKLSSAVEESVPELASTHIILKVSGPVPDDPEKLERSAVNELSWCMGFRGFMMNGNVYLDGKSKPNFTQAHAELEAVVADYVFLPDADTFGEKGN